LRGLAGKKFSDWFNFGVLPLPPVPPDDIDKSKLFGDDVPAGPPLTIKPLPIPDLRFGYGHGSHPPTTKPSGGIIGIDLDDGDGVIEWGKPFEQPPLRGLDHLWS
jgi:hypothetical protein